MSQRSEHGSSDPTTNAKIEARLRESLRSFPPNSQVQRIALADVTYPADGEENRKLGGFTLLLVTALSHDAGELPPARVFFHHENGDFEIPPLFSRVGGVEPPDLKQAYGEHRFDGLYAVPIQMTQASGKLLANFRGGGRDFHLLTFPGSPLPPGVDAIDPGEPDPEALHALAEREFPVIRERGLDKP
jgi:hypothetical protein